MAEASRSDLERWTRDFTQAFNDNDLDRVMSYFAPNGVYDQFNDEAAEGFAAIRAAFEPQFKGDFGEMRFNEENVFVDPEAHKILQLNVTALAVFRRCDGQTTMRQVAQSLADSFNVAFDSALDQVEQVVGIFADSGLLVLEDGV